jgi:hypothetical protein
MPSGSPDPAFGAGGTVTYYVSGYYDQSNNIILDSSVNIITTGYRLNPEKKTMMVLWRFKPAGSLDSTFNPV